MTTHSIKFFISFSTGLWQECQWARLMPICCVVRINNLTVDVSTVLSNSVKRKKKVKCTLVQALMLCTGRTAHKGSRGLALLFLDHGTRRGWGVSVTPRPLFTPGKDPVPFVQEAGWARQVWKISPPPEFEPRTIQSVASLYIDYATRPISNSVPAR